MKKRNCRKTTLEREQHDTAIRIRKMTDAQLCEYIDELERASETTSTGPSVRIFFEALGRRTASGLRVSDATIRKLRSIAEEEGLLPREEA